MVEILIGCNQILQLKKSEIHNYGVFTNHFIKNGKIIEKSHIIKLFNRTNNIKDQTVLDHIYSNPIIKENQSIDPGIDAYLGLGFLSMYNHKENSNAKVITDFENDNITVVAKRDIEPGEEIFITYGENHFKIKNIFSNLNQEVLKKLEQIEKNHCNRQA